MAQALRWVACVLALAGAAFSAFFGEVLYALSKLDSGGAGGLIGPLEMVLPFFGALVAIAGVVLLWRQPSGAAIALVASAAIFAIPFAMLGAKILAYAGVLALLVAAAVAARATSSSA